MQGKSKSGTEGKKKKEGEQAILGLPL